MISHNPYHHPEPSLGLGTILCSVLHNTRVPMDNVPGEMPVLVLGTIANTRPLVPRGTPWYQSPPLATMSSGPEVGLWSHRMSSST